MVGIFSAFTVVKVVNGKITRGRWVGEETHRGVMKI